MANIAPNGNGSPRSEECGLRQDGAVCRIPKGHELSGIPHQMERPEKQSPEYAAPGSAQGELERWKRRALAAEERERQRVAGEAAFPPRVVIESPFRGSGAPGEFERNVAYAKALLRDSYMRGEAPIASHLLGPQVLDDADPNQRDIGITAGLAWGSKGRKIIVGIDRGISAGMHIGISRYKQWGIEIIERSLGEEWKK